VLGLEVWFADKRGGLVALFESGGTSESQQEDGDPDAEPVSKRKVSSVSTCREMMRLHMPRSDANHRPNKALLSFLWGRYLATRLAVHLPYGMSVTALSMTVTALGMSGGVCGHVCPKFNPGGLRQDRESAASEAVRRRTRHDDAVLW
jgi:hypothetical protein